MKFTKGQEFLAESFRAMVRLGCGRNAINPARDLGPRLFAVVAGFKNNRLIDGPSVWLQPVLGPMVGGLLGGFAMICLSVKP
jgi:glycerol uptake facilitator-like aquaporin